MEFGRRRFVRGSSGGVPNRVCVTPEPTTYYGEYSRRSLVKNFHAHEKEYWHNQQQEQLERLDGMFQEYKQSSRKGNKSDRDVTATWTPRPNLCQSPSSFAGLDDDLAVRFGMLEYNPGSRGRTPTQASNFNALSYRQGSSNASDFLQSPRAGSPMEDDDLLKEALLAARNVMEDQQPISVAKSVSGASIFSDSDARSSIQNFSKDYYGLGVVNGGLQWEEDALDGCDTSRSYLSDFKAQKQTHRDLWGDVQHGQHQDQDTYDSYHAKLYMRNEPRTTTYRPADVMKYNRIANHHKPVQSMQGSVQQSGDTTPKQRAKDKYGGGSSVRYTYGLNAKSPPASKASPGPNERTKSAGLRTPGRSASMAVRGTQPKRTESSASRTRVLNHSQSTKNGRNRLDGKTATPYGPAKQIIPAKSRHDSGTGRNPHGKGGSTPYGSAQRLRDPKAGITGGPIRTPRDEGASLKPRMPLTQHRTGLGGSSGKVRRSSGYSNFQG